MQTLRYLQEEEGEKWGKKSLKRKCGEVFLQLKYQGERMLKVIKKESGGTGTSLALPYGNTMGHHCVGKKA